MRLWIIILLALCFNAGLSHAEDTRAKERQIANQLARNTPNIYKLTTKTGVAFRLQTAIGYITTIDLPEEALKVFAGDQDLFKVEVYGSQVIIKPMTDYMDARTNLTIYMQKGRLSFDVTVGSPETADFVLDFRFPSDEAIVENAFKEKLEEKKQELEEHYQEELEKQDEKVEQLTQEMFEEALKKGAKTIRLKKSEKHDGIQLNLLSLSEIGGKSYLRFSVLNYSDSDYSLERIVLGKETSKRRGFNLRRESFVPIEFTENIEKTIPKNSYHYGLVSFDKVYLKKNERFVIRLYEQGKVKPLEISKVPVEA